MKNAHIKIWRWQDAPEELKALSDHGGDEDWVALIPPELKDTYIGFLEEGTSFGCCDVKEYLLLDGHILKIGAHA